MTKSGEMTIRDKLRLRYWTWRIQRAGLFDSAYFAAQTGLNLRSDRDAIRHCLAGAVQTTSTVHPLIEPSWIAYQSVNSDWFVALFRDRALSSSGPLFRAVRGRRSLAAELNQFLKSDSSSVSALRSCQGQETDGALEQARDELTRVAETFWEQDARSRRRNPTDWDVAGEQRFLATLDPAVEPVSTGTPLVSVIMPTFNRASLIGAAIKSVRQQTVRSWELIIVDDGSTDDTAALLAGLQGEDARIRLVSQANAGVSAARNNGIAHAAGRYIAFLDSDNVWTPDFLRASLAELQAQEASGSYSAVEIQLDGGEREYLGAPAERQDLLDGRNLVDLNALIVLREILVAEGGFDTGLRRWVDYDLVLRLLRDHELVYVPMIGVLYDHRASAGDRITTSESPLWRLVVLEKNLLDWVKIDRELGSRVTGRTSVLIRTRRQWAQTLATIESLLQLGGDADVEIVVMDTASPRAETAILTAAFLGDRRVRIQRTATDVRRPTALNLAFAESTGDVIVIGESGVLAVADWIGSAREAARVIAGGRPASIYATGAMPVAEFSARHGFTPMPDGDLSGESLVLRDGVSA
ncbi:glycosyltransferase family 2 protein [Glaciibacter psychrotolerans]|uniref:Glycosyltransferase involved in cell wall biosynthesis n=1 Tax=Glaciibacter psychrotolerans TaxID=670054 RepID=A0A7Z0EFP3_9MICO|nr:glycosyltransferase family 2 protein [Leifsonia psychrotolerans]NYJ20596.1 glycosyltransferase involved in cell wall biosynthesis [Leifsonia psychrotolerans]